MSRANITSITPNGPRSIVVTFHTKDGGERSYQYDGFEAAQILSGADPKYFNGREVPTRFGGGVMSPEDLMDIGADIALEL